MRKYRGYYIDHVYFNSTKEIDAYLKEQAVRKFLKACKYFYEHPTMEASIYQTEASRSLIKQHGFTPAEVEELEIQAIS